MHLASVAGYRELVSLTEEQRKELTGWANSRSLPAGDVFRARLILALADGMTYAAIKLSLQTTAPRSRVGSSASRNQGLRDWSRNTRAASRGRQHQRCRPRSAGRSNRNHKTAVRNGQCVNSPPNGHQSVECASHPVASSPTAAPVGALHGE